MKIVKRDGRIVEYNPEKIRIAIKKANNDVEEYDQVNDLEIVKIIKSIEKMKKKRLLVEDIQDIIEKKLVELNKYELSKAYMLYRYERELIRKANTIDESILTLIKNSQKEKDKSAFIVASQRDLIAGEVSKDLTKRLLLPEEISKSHEKGILYFHDEEYFVQPMFASNYVNISDMLENGVVLNQIQIDEPKSFNDACTFLTQIIARIASSQYDSQTINIKYISKYLKMSHDKIKKISEKSIQKSIQKSFVDEQLKEELYTGIKLLEYQINTLITVNGKSPDVTFFLELDEFDPYIDYTKLIIEEILKQRIKGFKNESNEYLNFCYPKLIYTLNDNNYLEGKKYNYLTNLAIECFKKCQTPSFLSVKKMKELFDSNVFAPIGPLFLPLYKDQNKLYKIEGRFNQGSVSINLAQIALESKKDENVFFFLLENRLELCYEALICRYHALLGTLSDVSPIEFQYGAVARLEKKEPIDKLLKNGYSTLALGYVGLYEATKYMIETNLENNIENFSLKVLKTLKNACNKWKKETGIEFILYKTKDEKIRSYFLNIDKNLYGSIKEITDKDSYCLYNNKIDAINQLKMEQAFQSVLKDRISYIKLSDEKIEDLIPYIYENLLYVEFTNPIKNDILD